jgi:regulator of replication initiation timing
MTSKNTDPHLDELQKQAFQKEVDGLRGAAEEWESIIALRAENARLREALARLTFPYAETNSNELEKQAKAWGGSVLNQIKGRDK